MLMDDDEKALIGFAMYAVLLCFGTGWQLANLIESCAR